ncbi:MAG: hypothetical protein FJ271_33700, partial [Planctomycetes bacterium]|nr:hypothetical protein [Planctomycetota bacterium]
MTRQAPALAVCVALVAYPAAARAELCDDSLELLAGDVAACDGVLVGPVKLGELLKDKERQRVCALELDAAVVKSSIDAQACQHQADIQAVNLNLATARAEQAEAQLDRFPWSHVLTS